VSAGLCAQVSDGALSALIEQHCRESGVRNLKKQLEKIYRKLALQLVTSQQLRVRPRAGRAGRKGRAAGRR